MTPREEITTVPYALVAENAIGDHHAALGHRQRHHDHHAERHRSPSAPLAPPARPAPPVQADPLA